MTRSFLSLLFVGGCFGAGDDIKIGHGTGRYRGWDSAACICDVRTDFAFVGQTIQLGCMPMFDGYDVSTTLVFPVPGQRNTVAWVQVADFFDESALGAATVEVSSEVDEEGRLAVWIDKLVVAPHSCDGDGVYYYYSDICEPFEGGTLEDARMFCVGE